MIYATAKERDQAEHGGVPRVRQVAHARAERNKIRKRLKRKQAYIT